MSARRTSMSNSGLLEPQGEKWPSNGAGTASALRSAPALMSNESRLAIDIKFSAGTLDLFGEPIAPPRGRGRPSHVPTKDLRQKVVALRAQGLTLIETAAAIGITHPTLLLHYHAELKSRSEAWRKLTKEGPKQ